MDKLKQRLLKRFLKTITLSFVLNAARVIGIDLYKKEKFIRSIVASNKLVILTMF